MGFVPKGFSAEIFKQRYAFTENETWSEMSRRAANQAAKAEKPEKVKKYEDRFHDIINKNLFVPGGRILYGAGRNNPNMLNCFVLSDELDSKEGWGQLAKEMIITSMHGGGVGCDFSDIRPKGSKISSGGIAPGPIELMKLINNCASPIRAGGKRRVALMFSLDLDHPDIMEFLDAKLENGELTNANISVRCKETTKFIKAIKSNEDWELNWKKQYKKKIKARELWDKIVSNNYNSAEPGFLNWELVLKEANTSYCSPPVSTNPCGEHPLSPYDCCCLGHLVLSRFVEGGKLNKHKLADTIRIAVRFLDNILTVNTFPLSEMESTSNKLRRIGLGVTALADTLASLGYRYGSEEGNLFINDLFKFIKKSAYETSIMLAVEKGSFSAFDSKKYLNSDYMRRMPKKIRSLIAEHGIRNCTILTIAPTGTVSIISANCSSGIEPMFAPAYERRYWKDDERKMELVFHPLFKQFVKEGKNVDHFVGYKDLLVKEHLEVQKIIQNHIDQACSKTINIPENYKLKEMKSLWLEYLPYLKGTTFYRENTRGYVDKDGNILEPPLKSLSLKEALSRLEEEHVIDSTSVNDCPSGTCELD